jgi:hypothetical protein
VLIFWDTGIVCNRVLLCVTILGGAPYRVGGREKGRECYLFYGYFVYATPGGEIYLSGGMFIKISDSIYGISRKPRLYMI